MQGDYTTTISLDDKGGYNVKMKVIHDERGEGCKHNVNLMTNGGD
jgi:hypothetical protein